MIVDLLAGLVVAADSALGSAFTTFQPSTRSFFGRVFKIEIIAGSAGKGASHWRGSP